MSTRLFSVVASIDVDPDRVVLCELTPGYPLVQIGSAISLHVHEATPEALLAISTAFAKAANLRALKAVA